MQIAPSRLLLPVLLAMSGCHQWGAPQELTASVALYADVQALHTDVSIVEGTLCQIDQRLSAGKVDGYHQIRCENGQSGYIHIADKSQFNSVIGPPQTVPHGVPVYADVEKLYSYVLIEEATLCQIDQRRFAGKFYQIQCHNGQSGYITESDKKRFDSVYR